MPPQVQSGYGTEVILDLIPYELGGTVDLVHSPEGVRAVASHQLDQSQLGRSKWTLRPCAQWRPHRNRIPDANGKGGL